MAALGAEARAWLSADPDHETQAELRALIDAAEEGDTAALAERFVGRLQFGTAGMRGELGAGPMRMNRVTVRRATAGLVAYLLAAVPDAAERGIVIGYDARRKSDAFARDTAGVAAALGLRARLLPGPTPDAGPRVGRAPPRGGGRGDGDGQPQPAPGQRVQGLPGGRLADRVAHRRRDRGGHRCRRARLPGRRRTRSPADRPPRRRADGGVPGRRAVGASGPGAARRHRRLHPHARRRRCDPPRRVRASRLGSAGGGGRTVRTRSRLPDGVVPEPGGAGGDGPAAGLGRAGGRRRGPGQRPRRRPPWRGHTDVGRRLAPADRRRAGLAPGRSHPVPHHRGGPPGRDDAGLVVAPRPHGVGGRRSPRRNLHRVQVDRPGHPGASRPALRVRLRAGARLSGGRAAPATRTASPRPS